MINNSLIILDFETQIDRDITVMITWFMLPCIDVNYLTIIVPNAVFGKHIKQQFEKIV